jgi:hypothetical protein
VRIGLDLDNTLIDYEAALTATGIALGAVPAGVRLSKRDVRDRIRALPDGETRWIEVQAHVYGPGIDGARLYPGVPEFIAAARERGIELAIVSHKTEYAVAAPDGPSLRACARDFLRKHEIELPVYFESTRSEKCARLARLGITHAIDDLIEVFDDAAFPPGIERWLFAPYGSQPHPTVDRHFVTWRELREAIGA